MASHSLTNVHGAIYVYCTAYTRQGSEGFASLTDLYLMHANATPAMPRVPGRSYIVRSPFDFPLSQYDPNIPKSQFPLHFPFHVPFDSALLPILPVVTASSGVPL